MEGETNESTASMSTTSVRSSAYSMSARNFASPRWRASSAMTRSVTSWMIAKCSTTPSTSAGETWTSTWRSPKAVSCFSESEPFFPTLASSRTSASERPAPSGWNDWTFMTWSSETLAP